MMCFTNTPFTLQVTQPAVIGIRQNAPVLQLPFDVLMQTLGPLRQSGNTLASHL